MNINYNVNGINSSLFNFKLKPHVIINNEIQHVK